MKDPSLEAKVDKNPSKTKKEHDKPNNMQFISNFNKDKRQRIKSALSASRDEVSFLLALLQQHNTFCLLHIEGTHVIWDYWVLETICKECSATRFLNKTKEQFKCIQSDMCAPAPIQEQQLLPAIDNARLASVLTALDMFKIRFDPLEENVQAMNKVTEVDDILNESSNIDNSPYFQLYLLI